MCCEKARVVTQSYAKQLHNVQVVGCNVGSNWCDVAGHMSCIARPSTTKYYSQLSLAVTLTCRLATHAQYSQFAAANTYVSCYESKTSWGRV